MTTIGRWRGAWLEVETKRIELPNGNEIELDLVRHPGASAVAPILPDGRVLLIRQYRYATGGYILEVPAGKLEPGEAPEACAARELLEEAGQRARRIEHLASIWTTPGFTDERIHLYAAFDLQATEQQLQHDEVIELVPMPLEAALERVWSGEIDDAKSSLALLHTARKLGRLA